MAANQNGQMGQVPQDQGGKEQEVRRDEFGEINDDDASNLAAQQQGNINNNQEQNSSNTVLVGNMAPNQGQNLGAN